jgi:Ca-activated chloride channel homolog
MKWMTTILACALGLTTVAQKANEAIQSGNDYYRHEQYELARKEYETAVNADPSNTTAKINLANTIYRQGKQDEAIRNYDEIASGEKNTGLKSQSFYNKGAILSKQKKLEESIEAYKNALRQNSNDKEARENLQKALLELKKRQPPPEKKEDKKKKKEQQKQKEKPRPQMNQKEAEQRLKLLEQKEKEVLQRLQKEKTKTGGGQAKDW